MRIFGKGFNFGQDGPGNRFVYHLSGCNMRCLWCSNADGMDKNAGKEYSPEEVIKEALSCRPMFFSGGGVTFTGGEATLQADELLYVLKALKKEGIHTCLETNATSNRLLEISKYIDFLIMDFKHFDNDALKEFTGIGNEVIKENFEALCKENRQLLVRIPLINGVNTDDPEKFAEYFSHYAHDKVNFEFLLYHEYGKEKWKTEYKIKDGFVSKETLNKFKEVFKKHNLKIITT